MGKTAELWNSLNRCAPADFIEDAYMGATPPTPTGMDKLDEALTGGLKPGLTVIMGQPGAGKSAMGLAIAASVASRAVGGGPVLYYSLEMGYTQCRFRIMSWLASTYGDDLGLEPFVWSEVSAPKSTDVDELRRAKDPVIMASDAFQAQFAKRLRIIDDVWDVDEICETVEKLCKGGCRPLVVVDYLQIVGVEGYKEEYAKVTEASHRLAQLAKDCEIIVIALSSMSREQGRSENPKNKKARNPMSGARGSGHVEYDAQAIVRLVKGTGNDIGITVPKNRGGRTYENPKHLRFDGAHNVFIPLGTVRNGKVQI